MRRRPWGVTFSRRVHGHPPRSASVNFPPSEVRRGWGVRPGYGDPDPGVGAPPAVGTTPPPPGCTSVRAELGLVGAAAGSAYLTIRLRNTGTTTCRIGGYPPVEYVYRHHDLIGWPAGRDRMRHLAHTLGAGQAARTVLVIPCPRQLLSHRLPGAQRSPDPGPRGFRVGVIPGVRSAGVHHPVRPEHGRAGRPLTWRPPQPSGTTCQGGSSVPYRRLRSSPATWLVN